MVFNRAVIRSNMKIQPCVDRSAGQKIFVRDLHPVRSANLRLRFAFERLVGELDFIHRRKVKVSELQNLPNVVLPKRRIYNRVSFARFECYDRDVTCYRQSPLPPSELLFVLIIKNQPAYKFLYKAD